MFGRKKKDEEPEWEPRVIGLKDVNRDYERVMELEDERDSLKEPL